MDNLTFTSHVSLTKSTDGKFVAHATLVDGSDIALENGAVAIKALPDLSGVTRRRYDRKDGSGSFDKWYLPGSFDLTVEPKGATLGRLVKAAIHPFDDGGIDGVALEAMAVAAPKAKPSAMSAFAPEAQGADASTL